jgi:hypothetical protein
LNSLDFDKLSPVEAYNLWDGLTYTIDDPRESSERAKHAIIVALHYRWMWVALGVCVLGLLVTGFGGMVSILQSRGRQPTSDV